MYFEHIHLLLLPLAPVRSIFTSPPPAQAPFLLVFNNFCTLISASGCGAHSEHH